MLDGPEAHHLINVMRAKPGASITLFDNSGAEFTGVVDAVRRSEATIRIVERCEIDRELPCSLTVGIALPKGDRQKWLVEKLTELGVTELVPLVTERSVAQPTDKAAERLDRAVSRSCKAMRPQSADANRAATGLECLAAVGGIAESATTTRRTPGRNATRAARFTGSGRNSIRGRPGRRPHRL